MTPPAGAAAARARTLAPARPLVPTRRPRRVSGPARPTAPARPAQPARRGEQDSGGLVLGLLELLRAISGHRLLDRLIRGRAWIAIVAFALIGIVTLQLLLLKLNTSVGRSLERTALLQRENAALSIENSELAAGGRVEATAGRLGMSLVPAGGLKFLTARPREDPFRAATALNTPVHTLAGSEEAAAAAARSEATSSTVGEQSSATTASATGATSAAPSEGAATSSTSGASSEASAAETPASSSSAEGAPAGSTSERAAASAGAAGASATTPAAEAGAGGGTQASPTG